MTGSNSIKDIDRVQTVVSLSAVLEGVIDEKAPGVDRIYAWIIPDTNLLILSEDSPRETRTGELSIKTFWTFQKGKIVEND